MRYKKEDIHEKLQKITYENGLRVLIENIPYLNTVCLGIWIKTGSGNETIWNNGISHFVEHLLFKCYDSSMSQKRIISYLESEGGQINAFTEREFTCFSIRALENDLPVALNVISNMICNRKFTSYSAAQRTLSQSRQIESIL